MANPQRIPETSAAAATQIRAIVTQLSDTKRGAVAALDGSLAVASPRDAASAVRRREGRGQGTGRVDQHGLHHRRRGSRRSLSPAKGAPVDELRASMAISTRTKRPEEANAFTLARMLVPASDIGLGERFKRIQEATDAAASGVGPGEPQRTCGRDCRAADLVARADRPAADRDVDFGTSNVRGSPVPLFLAGARVDENYPIGPTGGTAFNLTCCRTREASTWASTSTRLPSRTRCCLRTLMEESFAELVSAGQPPAKSARRSRATKKPAKRTVKKVS